MLFVFVNAVGVALQLEQMFIMIEVNKRRVMVPIKTYRYEALCLSSAMLWGLAFPVMKFVGGGIDTVSFLALRFLIATVVLAIACGKKLKGITSNMILPCVAVGILFALHNYLQVEGLRYTSAANGGFITSTNVVFVPAFAYLILKKRPTVNMIVGLAAATAGFLLISGIVTVAPFGFHLTSLNVGDLLVLLCAVFTALYFVVFNMITQKYDESIANLLHMAGAAVGMWLVWMFYPQKSMDLSSPITVGGLLYCAVFASAIGFLLMAKASAKLEPSKVAIICALECVFAAAFAALVTWGVPYPDGSRETITLTTVLGGALVFYGVIKASIETRGETKCS